MVEISERGNEPSGNIKSGKFIVQVSDFRFRESREMK
jgi:hypothetical protein